MCCEPQELALGFQLSSVTSLVPWVLAIRQHPEEGRLSARRRALGREGEEKGAALVLVPQGSPLLNPQRPCLYLWRPLCPLPVLRSALSPPCKICHLLLNVV